MANEFTDSSGLPTFFKNRQTKRFAIEKLEKDSDAKPTKKELQAEISSDANLYTEHRREMFAAENKIINAVGRKTWDSSKTKFHKGDSYSMSFLNDEEDTEMRKNRFSGSINLSQAFNQVKQRLVDAEKVSQNVNRDLNKLECDHMEWCAGVYDRSNREVMRDIRSNIYADRNTDKELGNTSKITKSQSKSTNEAILSDLRKDLRSGGSLHMNTTIDKDCDGDQFEKDSIFSEKNIKFADGNVNDEAAYKEERLKNISSPVNHTP
jgi:hypothetical protein